MLGLKFGMQGLSLQFGFVIFGHKEIGEKAAHKMLMRLIKVISKKT